MGKRKSQRKRMREIGQMNKLSSSRRDVGASKVVRSSCGLCLPTCHSSRAWHSKIRRHSAGVSASRMFVSEISKIQHFAPALSLNKQRTLCGALFHGVNLCVISSVCTTLSL